MAVDMDFPLAPSLGQKYTNSLNITYEWNGYAWVVGYYDSAIQTFTVLGDIMDQIRTLLQDTDNSSTTGYRYSDDSIVMNINMGLWEMFRLRPDIFLEVGYVVPQFNSSDLSAPWPIEGQWVPPIVYYAVGVTQVRDDEGTQDTRAAAFMQRFTAQLMTVTA